VKYSCEFRTIVSRIIDRAIVAEAVRADLTAADFPLKRR